MTRTMRFSASRYYRHGYCRDQTSARQAALDEGVMANSETLEERVIDWLKGEGLDVGGAPLARGESLLQFVKNEIAAEFAKAADIAHDNLDHATRDELDARGVVVHKIYETGPADVLTFFWQLDEIA